MYEYSHTITFAGVVLGILVVHLVNDALGSAENWNNVPVAVLWSGMALLMHWWQVKRRLKD